MLISKIFIISLHLESLLSLIYEYVYVHAGALDPHLIFSPP